MDFPLGLFYVVFFIPNIFLNIPPITLGLLISTTFIEKLLPYLLQRATPHITSAIASNTTINLSGKINVSIRPTPSATNIKPLNLCFCLPTINTPYIYLLHYTQGVFLCYICVSIIISVPFWTDISP